MDLYQRQQFDFILSVLVERFVERIEQRNEDAETALKRLREEPEGDSIWLSEFVAAAFSDFLLDNLDGACFVLRALPARRAVALETGTVERALISLAQKVFAELLKQKTEESLEQRIGYQPVSPGA
jgi:hypothetical protein